MEFYSADIEMLVSRRNTLSFSFVSDRIFPQNKRGVLPILNHDSLSLANRSLFQWPLFWYHSLVYRYKHQPTTRLRVKATTQRPNSHQSEGIECISRRGMDDRDWLT
jgi:hypothetical protein